MEIFGKNSQKKKILIQKHIYLIVLRILNHLKKTSLKTNL